MDYYINKQAAIDAITAVPPGNWSSKRYVNAINALPSVDVPHWIPCSERMPPKSGEYIVSGRWAGGKVAVGSCEYSKVDGYFQTAWTFDVLAWMPLPEPWRGKQNG